MMRRKWTALAALAATLTLTIAGLSMAQDKEHSKMEELMEKVGKKNTAINKAVRTPIAFTKGKQAVIDDSKELVKLFKEARESKEPAEQVKKPFDSWTKYTDDMIKATEDFTAVAEKGSHPDTKKSFEAVKKACADCHKDFRVEDE